MWILILIIFSYLVGSIPFAQVIAKSYGKDLRQIGSGNIGATNLTRALGKRWGYICFCLDVLKGMVPMFAATRLIFAEPGVIELFGCLFIGAAAILGHIFPVYMKFKGGKGVATSFGVALGFWPYFTICAIISLAVWVIVVLLFRYVSLGSIVASISFPIALVVLILLKSGWYLSGLWPLLVAAIAIPVMVILRHRSNIKRIMAGTESRIES